MTSIRPFTPTREDPAVLDARTVGRDTLLARLARVLRTAGDSDTLAHTLIVGPRGSGKSHVLAVAIHRALQDPALAAQLAVVRIPEDGIGIGQYQRLIDEIATRLANEIGATRSAGIADGIGAIEAEIQTLLADRTLVLVIENLNRVFRALGPKGQEALRGWVETTRRVLLVASTPLLFDDVADRSMPWFGSFNAEHLDELGIDDAATLLIQLRPGEQELHDFIRSDTGRARLQALDDLTGGSPRLWTILADVITVDLLDDLVPAIEKMLEELVPYYQERLWDLGGNEQAIVHALGTGSPSQTATMLSEVTGIDQRTAGTTLGRLAESRWVRGRKEPGTDQRATWYELREPMLRHHFQYRDGVSGPLVLVIDILRAWYDPDAREQLLLEAPSSTERARYLSAALEHDAPIQASRDNRTVDDLLVLARRWIGASDPRPGSARAGALLESIVAFCRNDAVAESALPARVVDSVGDGNASSSDSERLIVCIDAAAVDADEPDASILRWTAAAWLAERDPAAALERLEAIRRSLGDGLDHLRLAIDHEIGNCLGLLDRSVEAIATFEAVIEGRQELLGRTHPDTMFSRYQLVFRQFSKGDFAAALARMTELADDCAEEFGPVHTETLICRHNVAFLTYEAGDAATALTLMAAVADDRGDSLGHRHPNTLNSRHELARFMHETGDSVSALELMTAVVEASIEALGPIHVETLTSRYELARYSNATGDLDAEHRVLTDLLHDIDRSGLDDLPAKAQSVVALAAARFIRSDVAVDIEVGTDGLLGDLLRAKSGDAESAARLPAEIRRLLAQTGDR